MLAFLRNNQLSEAGKKLVWQYYRTLFLSTPRVATLQVRYNKAKGARFYARAPAAQLLPSEARLFLFGSNHVELDMIAAQMQIFVFAATGSLLYAERAIANLRDHFHALLCAHNHRSLPDNYIKQLFNVFLNTSASKVIAQLQHDFFFVPQEIPAFFRHLESRRPLVLQFAIDRGFTTQHTTPANQMYYALEYMEQQFLQSFTANLCEQVTITSLIYVHDGFYCAPTPTVEQLQNVMHLTTQQQQLPYFPLKMIDLAPKWHQLYGPLLPANTFAPNTSARTVHPHHAHAHITQGSKRALHVLSDQQDQRSLDKYFNKKFKLQLHPAQT